MVYIWNLKDEDELVILTDLLAGSVNQKLYKYISRDRYVIHVTKNDFCISSSTGKILTEQVDGTVIR